MNEAILDILDELRASGVLDAVQLDKIVREHSRRAHDGRRTFAKKKLLSYYLEQKSENSTQWKNWNVDDELHELMLKTLQMKPRRTASGVATITVITKPWPCANRCVYCPNDPTMPKSYLRDEPACQRAERNLFDPYLQVASRLRSLQQMGHATDKIELIVLGGTWLDYPASYRLSFVGELFRCLNDSDENRAAALSGMVVPEAQRVKDLDGLEGEHRRNEVCSHRVVGLVIETRPDTVTVEALVDIRKLGCTKIQLGVQSIDDDVLALNGRRETAKQISRALDIARLCGFKTHTHFMINLLGSNPNKDAKDYKFFANDPAFSPDEVKLYPCALVANTQLVYEFEQGRWEPYTEEELVDMLVSCMTETPPYLRVSRMIRDISAKDILVGNKKTNLRQLVDNRLEQQSLNIREIRFREIATSEFDFDSLRLEEVHYETSATHEVFIQWVTPKGEIAGFLRLSLPKASAFGEYENLPVKQDEAMIREVHVYGIATRVGDKGDSAQHRGLGRSLVERAKEIAIGAGYKRLNVISSVGTREYYRSLGFCDSTIYQSISLENKVFSN